MSVCWSVMSNFRDSHQPSLPVRIPIAKCNEHLGVKSNVAYSPGIHRGAHPFQKHEKSTDFHQETAEKKASSCMAGLELDENNCVCEKEHKVS